MSLELNYANFNDKKDNRINIPPDGYKKHPYGIDKKSLSKTIKEIGKEGIVEIPVHETREKQEEQGQEMGD